MRNILLKLKFLGTNYHGWQVQKNARSVQAQLQDALEELCGTRPPVTGCSRTDAGVHANMYCCTLRTDSELDCFRLKGGLNAVLPSDISVFECREVSESFHPRYSCIGKEYIYKINNAPDRDPFSEGRALHLRRRLDEQLLDLQAKDFIGKHDFTAFCGAGHCKGSPLRTVFDASVKRRGDEVVFCISADGFLYNSVRIMTGTLLFIAEGKIKCGSVPAIFESRERSAAGTTAPACGLYLNRVFYEGEAEDFLCGRTAERDERK